MFQTSRLVFSLVTTLGFGAFGCSGRAAPPVAAESSDSVAPTASPKVAAERSSATAGTVSIPNEIARKICSSSPRFDVSGATQLRGVVGPSGELTKILLLPSRSEPDAAPAVYRMDGELLGHLTGSEDVDWNDPKAVEAAQAKDRALVEGPRVDVMPSTCQGFTHK